MPSYEKSKSSGLWSVRFREVSPQDGKTTNKRLSGFKTKTDAQYGYEDYVAAKKAAAEILSDDPKLEKEENADLSKNIQKLLEEAAV